MRTKSFILTFLMMMFCSIGFGQASYWGDPDTHCESTMTMITQIVVDGTIKGADVEIAAFCGDELRGTVRPDETQMNMVYLVIHGNIPTAGDPAEVISFRFYDHSAGRELFYPYPDIVFEDNKKIGDIEFLNTQTGIYAGDNLINFTSIAEVNGVKYGILQAAVNAAQAGETVTLLQSATGAGVVIDKNVTIDFATYTYTVNQAVGSAGTETLGFQILKNNNVTLKNGTLTSTTPVVAGKEVKMLVQNYANLTLTDMNLVDDTDHILYALSNNSGNVKLDGNTNITTDKVAFDVYDYTAGGYAHPVVNVNTTGTISGKIEVSESISNNLNISGGTFTVKIEEAWCADGYIPTEVEIDGNTYYTVHEGLLGSGTETDPFIIRSLGELKFFRDHVNAGKTRYNAENVYVALAANIDMASEDWSVNIGDDCFYLFKGIFDGNGFTISNLHSTETAQKDDGYVCTGLFGAIYGNAVIKNLTIENVNINTGEFTGNNVAAVVGFVYDVNGKTTTIENVTVKGDVNINASGVYGVGAIVGYSYEGGAVNIMNCKVVANEGSVITATSGTGAIIGYCAGRTTIDGCTVDNIDITGKGLVGGIAGITSISNTKNLTNNTVKNVNLIATKAEWVNSTAIAVGTMSGDGLTVANTIFDNVNASRMVGSVYAEQPTYVVPAVEARIENKYYGTFDAARAAAQEGNTITVLAPVVITENKTYDLTGLTVAGENVYPIFRIQNGANVVVANGNISNDDYVFVLGASDGSSAGNLTIESGVYTGTTTVASVTKGLLIINGGEFKVNASEYGATYMINCIDANYNDDSANVEIYGGKFYGFNPENNAAEGANTNFCAEGYAASEIEPGVYEVVAGMVLNETKGLKYATLAEAIAAADAGNTLVLLQNITEDVTVNKNLTIDGANDEAVGGKFDYTGTMTANKGLTVTVQNIDFVGGGFDKSSKSSTGNYTIKNCTFEDDGDYAYPLKFRGANKIIVENCTVKNYLYSFLYITSGTNIVSVKNVTVEDCSNYAVYFSSGVNTATIENLTVKNSNNGFVINNTANRALTLKNCKLENVGTAVADANGTNTITCTLFGNENDFGTSASSQYAKYVLAEADATLTAPEGANVTTSVAGYVVVYENAKYQLKPAVASITADDNTTTYYETLAGAVEAATSGQTVNLLKAATGSGLKINKDVTIDFGGFTYTINQAVGSTGTESQGFQLLKNNTVTLKNGNIAIAENTNVKWMFNAYANVTLAGLNVNCTNMATPAANEANYVLVVNNGGGATPTVNYSGVNVTNFPSTNQIWLDPTTIFKAVAGLEDLIETEEGYVVVYNNGEYTAIGAVAKIGEARFATLQAAINAVQNAETINIIANIDENVNIVQTEGLSFTIDGQIDNDKVQYTGTISIDGNGGFDREETLTIKNINFYNEVRRTALEAFDFIDAKSGQSHNVTVESCDFTDVYANGKNYVKGAEVKEANNWKFVNCTANEKMMNLLHYYEGSQNLVVNGGTVKAYYGIHIDSSVGGLFEGVAFESAERGFTLDGKANNTGEIVNTLKNVSFKNIDTPIFASIGNTDQSIRVFNIEGNVTSENYTAFTEDERVKFVLTATDATLQAQEGLNVTTSVAGHIVDYADGKYYLRVPNYVAAIGETKYESLQAAIDAASSGDEIEVLKDITFKDEDIFTAENYKVLVYVGDNKNITLNLNEHEIDIDYNGTSYSDLLSVVLVSNGAGLTVEGNGKITFTENSRNCAYMFFKRGTTGYLTINNGTFRMSDPEDSMIYTNGNQIVTIKGGTFILDEVGTRTTGFPLIFNASGNDANSIVVEGGTYNDDVNHQVWPSEVFIKKELALKYNDNDATWTVVDAVAYVTEDGRTKEREVGYATLADAVNPHDDLVDNLVTVLKAHETTVPAVVERDITIDFGGLEVTSSASPAIRIQGGANVTVKNGNMNTENYNFILGASDGSSTGNLTIESGSYKGASSVASVTKGLLTINGGEFEANASQWGSTYLINCIDANYNNGSAKVEIKGGKFHQFNPENNAAEGAGTNFCAEGYMAEKIECEHGDCYKVIEGVYVAQVGEVKYKTVTAAVAAAAAGETVTLIANVTENVTISKNLTIDGAGKNYTGNISVDNSVNSNVVATVKNVNFVDGTGYAVTTNRIKSITVENCTVTNYGYGFLYANKSTPTVVVKNVTVDGGNYGFHWVYGTKATLENVTMTNVTYGLYIQNYAGKTINVKNSTISSIAIWEKSAGVQTFNFEGDNTVGTLSASQYAKYVLAAEGATLTAPEGSTVTTTVEGYKAVYKDGKYCLEELNYVAAIGETKYESLQEAIDAAVDGDEIDLIKGIYVTEVNNDNTTEILVSGGVSYRALYTVSGKSVTIDLNDNILYSTAVAADFLYNVFAVANGGHLTIKTDGLNGHGQVINEAASSVYSLLFCYDGTMTIENGNYNLKNGGNGRGMIYSQQDETVTVNGGKFILGNVGELDNGSPWIFNASGQNTKNIIVNGGTFNDDILHQYYPFEVKAPKEKALQYNEGLWTMVDAVAYVDEQHKSGNYYTNEVGYATLEEAVAARKYNENADHVMTVTLLKEIDLGNTTLLVDSDEDYKNSNINFDFAEKDVEGSLTPAIRIQGGANVTIKNGKMNTTGYNFILGASDGSSAGNLTIESGTYTGTVTVASVTKGLLTIKGGEFKVNESDYGATYMINCIDANYNADPRTANVEIYGGTFYGFNPQDNAAETGGHANFCADGYGAVETSANVWEVTPAQVITFETKWNWVSHYVEGNTGSDILTQLQNGLGAYGVQIKNQFYYTNYNTENQSWSGSLRATSVTDMYKVNTSLASGETLPIQLTGAVVDPTHYPIELEVNWNYLGYPLSEPVNVGTVFSGFAKEGDYIKSRDQFAEYKDGRWYGNLRSMNPGEGYMYQRSIAGTFTYSYPSTREAVKANITSENNYWVPASSQYANNMTMVAVLDVKGGDYEVAAFVGGEVRGSARPVYIESLDAYMFFLTIHGEEVEEMTFKCYDLATGEEHDLNNRMNYSNDAVVGSIGNPYLLSRGTTGIGESAMSEVNIYPNPTTTGREVNLGSVCDIVEVFNALGVKIAEYQNVDTIDALETAGIYVIRITNNGNVQNCRLIVK